MEHHFRVKSFRLSYRHRTEANIVLKCYKFLALKVWGDRIETCSLSDFTTEMEPPW